jgi:Flp pilus assembly protein TadB
MTDCVLTSRRSSAWRKPRSDALAWFAGEWKLPVYSSNKVRLTSTAEFKTLEVQAPKPTINYALAVLGIIVLAFALPLAMVMQWLFLPAGHYPVILLALPALPILWLGSICLRRAGLTVDDFWRRWPLRRWPGLSLVIFGFGSLVLIFAMFLLASSLGFLD